VDLATDGFPMCHADGEMALDGGPHPVATSLVFLRRRMAQNELAIAIAITPRAPATSNMYRSVCTEYVVSHRVDKQPISFLAPSILQSFLIQTAMTLGIMKHARRSRW
jgi:hypothetical protein